MNTLLQQFLQESREALESIGSSLLAMERDPSNGTRLGELFRLVHTLKGNSGLFEFPALTTVLHAAEDVMDAVRNGALQFNQRLADQLLETADYVSHFLDSIDDAGSPGKAFKQPPQELVATLRAWLNNATAVEAAVPAPTTEVSLASPLAALPDDISDGEREAVEAAISVGKSVYRLQYVPAADCFFQGTDPLHLVRQLEHVLWRRITPASAWPAVAELDAYHCNLRIEVIAIAEQEALAEHFRYVSDQVTWHALVAPQAKTAADAAFSTLALDVLRAQLLALRACQHQPWLSGQQAAIVRTLETVLANAPADVGQSLSHSLSCARSQSAVAPLVEWVEAQLQSAERGNSQTVSTTSATPALDSAKAAVATDSEANSAVDATPNRRHDDGQKVLKVEQEKVDRLMNLIGEIVVAKNGLPYLAERAEKQYQQRELAREIKAQYAVINRIADDLQDAIMQVRMIPVSFVLQRFPRLVRDIARKLDKKVNLILDGEDTEADKNMIEALADPLVHIVRNSLDHGLEAPQERLAAGKSDTGTLRIRAVQNADHVSITIEDDGRGIDPEKIKAKVAAKGLLEPEALAAMSNAELVNLVFLPGFSTAEQISDLSGRGVGMDVVRSGIEKVGGNLQLTSQLGIGTSLTLTLPLSMTVTQVMVVESAGQRFGIPMEQVMETVRLPKQAVHTIKHQPTAQLRGRTIPLQNLNQLLALDKPQVLNDDAEYALLVLRSGGELVGLVIDDFHGSVDIILKPMVGIIGDLAGYSGTAVMGDGSILMILNPPELFQ